MASTAKDLLKSVINLIEREGENCPVYYQIFTHRDVVAYETCMGGEVDKKTANKVINKLRAHDSVCEHIFDLIDDELQQLQSRELVDTF